MNDPILAEASAMSPTEAIDREHLNLLSIFHFIVGAITILFSSIFIFHMVFMLVLAFNPEAFPGPPKVEGRPPQEFPFVLGLMMAIMTGCFVLTGWVLGGLTIYSGICLRRQRRRILSLVVAAIQCMFVPFGTVLGVFTIVVLMRDSVRRLYGEPV